MEGKDYTKAKQLLSNLSIETSANTHKYWWGNCKLEDTDEMRQLAPVIVKILEQEFDYKVSYTLGSLYISLKCKLD